MPFYEIWVTERHNGLHAVKGFSPLWIYLKYIISWQGMVDDRTKTIDSKWTVDNEITDRSVLSEELANFCSEYPIYQVKFLDDSETSTTIHTKGNISIIKLHMGFSLNKHFDNESLPIAASKIEFHYSKLI